MEVKYHKYVHKTIKKSKDSKIIPKSKYFTIGFRTIGGYDECIEVKYQLNVTAAGFRVGRKHILGILP